MSVLPLTPVYIPQGDIAYSARTRNITADFLGGLSPDVGHRRLTVGRYVVRRTGMTVPVLVLVGTTFIIFVAVFALLGNPIQAGANQVVPPTAAAPRRCHQRPRRLLLRIANEIEPVIREQLAETRGRYDTSDLEVQLAHGMAPRYCSDRSNYALHLGLESRYGIEP